MSAIVAGEGLGLFNTSLSQANGFGSSGRPNTGTGADRVYVNAVSGNLIIQAQDEYVAALGLDVAAIRTYNSRGLLAGEAGDWQLGFIRSLSGLPLVTAGVPAQTSITRMHADGHSAVFVFDSASGRWRSTAGDGAHDTIRYQSGKWIYEEGSSGLTETYDASGRIESIADRDGNTITYLYTGGRLVEVRDATKNSSGVLVQSTKLQYDAAGNVTEINVVSDGVTQTRVRYVYDASNQLSQVYVDLANRGDGTRDDLDADSASKAFVTTYEYDGAGRVTRVSQSDGSSVAIGYVQVGDDWRVARLTTLVSDGQPVRDVYFNYDLAERRTDVTDERGYITRYFYDAQNRLATVVLPEVNGVRSATQYAYDADGNVNQVVTTVGPSQVRTMSYTYENGNLREIRDDLGNTVRRTYNDANQLLTETLYPTAPLNALDEPADRLVTHYVYDAEQHVRFVVSAEGRVTEHVYDNGATTGPGQRTKTRQYFAATYAGSAFTEADLTAWTAAQNREQTSLVTTEYDFRGQVNRVTSYATVDSSGNGVVDGKQAVTQFVYTVAGELLQTIDPRGGSTTYTYDGLGRVQTMQDATGRLTTTSYDDANNTIAVKADEYAGTYRLLTTTVYNRAGERIGQSLVEPDPVNGATAVRALGTTEYFYDASGRLRTIAINGVENDSSPARTHYLYDARGWMVAEISPEGEVAETVRDDAGQVIRVVRYAGRVDTARLWNAATGRPADITLDQLLYRSTVSANKLPTADLNGTATGRDYSAYVSGVSQVAIVGSTMTVGDGGDDGATLLSATALLVNPKNGASERLLVTLDPKWGLVQNYDQTTGLLTISAISGTAQPASVFQSALRTLKYENTAVGGTRVTDPRTVQVVVSDGVDRSLVATSTVTFNRTPVVDLNGDSAGVDSTTTYVYNEGDPAVSIVNAGSVGATDADSADLVGATVRIVNLANAQHEWLSVTSSGGIQVNYDAARGELVLSGSSSKANYQTTLASLKYRNSSDSPIAGIRTIEVTVSDGELSSAPARTKVNVVPANDAPIAAGDAHVVAEDGVLVVAAPGVLGNDADAEGDALTAELVSSPTHGSLTLNANGSFTYQPHANYNGSDSFTYRARDSVAGSNVATVSISVTAVEDAPQPADDSYTLAEDTTLNSPAVTGVLANDVDGDGDTLTAQLLSGPAHGSLTLNPDGSFSYVPAANYYGADAFTYRVYDGKAWSDVARVTLNVTPVADAPVAVDDAYSVPEDTTLDGPSLLANDVDAEGDVLLAEVVTGPAHGTLTLNPNGTFIYTPAANYYGGDSFTYRIHDGTAWSNAAAVTLTIASVNDAPAASDDSYTLAEDSTLTVNAAAGVLANDTDIEGGALSAALELRPEHGQVKLNADGSFVYAPNADYSGTDRFTYRVSDGGAYSQQATVTLTVTALPDAPVALNDAYSLSEDVALTVSPAAGVLAQDTDADGDALTAQVVTGPAHGTLTLTADGGFNFVPNANYFGADSFTYKANDGAQNSNVATVTLTIVSVNDAPIVDLNGGVSGTGYTITYPEGAGQLPIVDASALTISDVDHSALTSVSVRITNLQDAGAELLSVTTVAGITQSYDATTGVLSIIAQNASAPIADFQAVLRTLKYQNTHQDPTSGTRYIAVAATDGVTEGPPAVAAVTVIPANNAPVVDLNGNAAGIGYQAAFAENAAAVSIVDELQLSVSDPDNSTLIGARARIANLQDPGSEFLSVSTSGGLVQSYDAATGILTLTPTGDAADLSVFEAVLRTLKYQHQSDAPTAGDRYVEVTVDDGALLSAPAVARVTVQAANDAPTAVADAFDFIEDEALAVSGSELLGNDVDAEGDMLRAQLVSGPSHGTLVFDDDGGFTYTPTANYAGTDSFTYRVFDGSAWSAVATVNLTGVSVNDAPVAIDDSHVVAEDAVLNVSAATGVLANDTDVEANALSAELVSGPSNGTVTLNADGSFSYAAHANYSGADRFTYRVTDGVHYSNEATVSLTVTPVADNPVAADDAYTVSEDTPYAVAAQGVLANDSDADGDSKSAQLVSGPTNGALDFNADGSFTYTPTADYAGSDSFTYQAYAGGVASNVATVSITVAAINDRPEVDLNGPVPGSGYAALYTQGSAPVSIVDASALTLTDVDNATLVQAIVRITNLRDPNEEVLAVTTVSGIVQSYEAATGTLTISASGGSASITAFRDVLRTLTYQNTADAPTPVKRYVEITVSDGELTSEAAVSEVSVARLDPLPEVDLNGAALGVATAVTFEEGSAPLEVVPDLAIAANGWTTIDAAYVELRRIQDQGFETISVDVGTSGLEVYESSTGGTIMLAVAGTASIETYQQVLRTVRYHHSSQYPTFHEPQRAIAFFLQVGDYFSPTVDATVTVLPVDDAGLLDLDADNSNAAGTGYHATYIVGGGPVGVVDADLAAPDIDSGTFNRAEARIIGVQDPQLELLSVAPIGQGISIAFDPAAGTMVLTGEAAASEYEKVLRTLKYTNLSPLPVAGTRAIEIVVFGVKAPGTIGDAKPSNVARAVVDVVGSIGAPSLVVPTSMNSSAMAPGLGAAAAQMASGADPDNRSEHRVHDRAGRLVFTVDARGYVIESVYDGLGRLTREIAYAGLLEIDASDGITESGIRDALALRAAQNDPSVAHDRVTRRFYHRDGMLRGILDAEGYLTESKYDSAGRLVETVAYARATPTSSPTNPTLRTAGSFDELFPGLDAQNDQRTFSRYDDRGQRIASVDPMGFLTECEYDASGNKLKETRYNGTVVYDATKSLATLRAEAIALTPPNQPRTHERSWAYDALGRVTSETESGTGATGAGYTRAVTTHVYDPVSGFLTRTTRADGTSDARSTTLDVDGLGRVERILAGEGSAALDAATTSDARQAVWNTYANDSVYDLAGRVVATADGAGNATYYYYDLQGRLRYTVREAVRNPDQTGEGEVVETLYNAFGEAAFRIAYAARIATDDLRGGVIGGDFPGLDRTASGNRVVGLEYDKGGLVERLTDAESFVTEFTYNAFRQLQTRASDIGTEPYQDMRLDLSTYDRRGLAVKNVVDAGRVGIETVRAFDAFGRVLETRDGRGFAWTTGYDRLGRAVTTTDPVNSGTLSTYDAFGRVLTQQDRLGNVTRYTYDDADRSISVETPEGIVTTTTGNRHGQTISITLNNDGVTETATYSYDKDGRLTATAAEGLPLSTSNLYDEAGLLRASIDRNGVRTTYEYDAANRLLTRTVDPAVDPLDPDYSKSGALALTTRYEYDAFGKAITVTDAEGMVTETVYDRKGQVSAVISDAEGLRLATTYAYDARGNALTVGSGSAATGSTGAWNFGPALQLTRYVYDGAGRRTQEITDPDGLAISAEYFYDENSNVIRKVDAEDNAWLYAYDELNRQVYAVDPEGGVAETRYDREGRAFETIRYANSIDASDLTGGETAVIGARASAIRDTARDRVVHAIHDADGRAVFTIESADYSIAQDGVRTLTANGMRYLTEVTYDAAGRVIRTTRYATSLPAGTKLTLAEVRTEILKPGFKIADQDQTAFFAYDRAGRRTFTVDALGYVTQTVYDANSNAIQTRRYARALPAATAGTDSEITLALPGLSDDSRDRVTRHVFDAAGRERFTLDSTGFVTEIRYDRTGRTVETVRYYEALASALAGNPAVAQVEAVLVPSEQNQSTAMRYDAAGRLSGQRDAEGNVEAYGYDLAGNRTSMVNKLGYTWTYAYDAAGRMIEETTPPVSVHAVDTSGNPTYGSTVPVALTTRIEYDALGNVTRRTEAYGLPNSRATEFVYDAAGRQIRTNHAIGSTTRTVGIYDAAAATADAQGGYIGRSESEIELYNRTWYNARGEAIAARDVGGFYGYKLYDVLGRVSHEVDAERYVTAYAYDAFGNVLSVTRYAVPLDENSTTGGPALSSLETSEANIAGAAYARVSQLVGSLSAAGSRAMTTRYDLLNQKVEVRQPQVDYYLPTDGNTYSGTAQPATTYAYNAFGDVTAQSMLRKPDTDGAGPDVAQWATTYFGYDKAGRLTHQLDALNYLTWNQYDGLGRLQRHTEYAKAQQVPLANGSPDFATYTSPLTTSASADDPLGYDRIAEFEYDRMDRQTVMRSVGVRFWEHDTDGSAVVESSSTSAVRSTVYDALGNVVAVTDASGATTRTYYDVLGRVIAVVEPPPAPTVAVNTVSLRSVQMNYAVTSRASVDEWEEREWRREFEDAPRTYHYFGDNRVEINWDPLSVLGDGNVKITLITREARYVGSSPQTVTRVKQGAVSTLNAGVVFTWADTSASVVDIRVEWQAGGSGDWLLLHSLQGNPGVRFEAAGLPSNSASVELQYRAVGSNGSWSAPVALSKTGEQWYANLPDAQALPSGLYDYRLLARDGSNPAQPIDLTSVGGDANGYLRGGLAVSRPSGQPASVRSTDAGAVQLPGLTEMSYDALGNVVKQVRYADGASNVSANGYSIFSPDGAHQITLQRADRLGRVIETTDAEGKVEYQSYDAFGKARKEWRGVTDVLGGAPIQKTDVYDYDRVGRQIASVVVTRSPLDANVITDRTGVIFNAFGETVAKALNRADGNGNGRLDASELPAETNQYEFMRYDDAGRVWLSNTEGVTKAYQFDLSGDVTAMVVVPGAASVAPGQSAGMGDVSLPASVAAIAGGIRTEIVRDVLGRVTQQREPTYAEVPDTGTPYTNFTNVNGFTSTTEEETFWEQGEPWSRWTTTQTVQMSWGNIAGFGAGAARAIVDYQTVDGAKTKVVNLGGSAALGATLVWYDVTEEQSGPPHGPSTMTSVTRVQVEKLVNNVYRVVRDTQAAQKYEIVVGHPESTATQFNGRIYYRPYPPGSESTPYSSRALTSVFGSNVYEFSLGSISGDYEYRIERQDNMAGFGPMTGPPNDSLEVNAYSSDFRSEWEVDPETEREWTEQYTDYEATLSWASLESYGTGAVRVTLDYVANGQVRTESFTVSGTSHTGATVRWEEPGHLAMSSIARVRVEKLIGGAYQVVRDTTNGQIYEVYRGTVSLNAGTVTSVGALPAVVRQPVRKQALDRWGNVLATYDPALGSGVSLSDPAQDRLLTHYRYDYRNQVVQVIQPEVTVWNANGSSTPGRPTLHVYYDAQGRVIGEQDANGAVRRKYYDNAGRVVEERSATNGVTRHEFDALGREVRMHMANGRGVERLYDRLDRLIRQETKGYAAGEGHYDLYAYDETGKRISETLGKRDSGTVVAGNTTRYRYDTQGRLLQTLTPLAGTNANSPYQTRYTWDERGHKVSETNANGDFQTWDYDYFGRLIDQRSLGNATTPGSDYDFLYDEFGRLKQTTNTSVSQTADAGNVSTHGQDLSYSYYANGWLRQITDAKLNAVTRYSYDLAGRHTREVYDLLGTSAVEQNVAIRYDALGRADRIRDERYLLEYGYDAVGNRRRTRSQFIETQYGIPKVQDYWYAFDAENRITVSKGTLHAAGVNITNTQGIRLFYDAAGNRTRSETYVSGALTSSTYRYDPENRIRESYYDNNVADTQVERLTTSRTYDTQGRASALIDFGLTGSGSYSRRDTAYDANGRMLYQTSSGAQQSVISYTYDYAGTVKQHRLSVSSGTSYTHTYDYFYLKIGGGYREAKIKGTGSASQGSFTPAQSYTSYDVNGQVSNTFVSGKSSTFVTSSQGQIVKKTEGTKSQYYFYANGMPVGSAGNITAADFDFNYTAVSDQYPPSVPGQYVAQLGDTAQKVALNVFGDSSLWYLIVDANGLSSATETIQEGRALTIPNQVSNLRNADGVFKPYNAAEIIGNTVPELKYNPPPPPKKKCGVLGTILVIVVAVVVSVVTYGAMSGVMAGWAGVMLAAGAAAAASSAASQLTAMALGMQSSFSWSAVGRAAVVGALTAGITNGLGLSGVEAGSEFVGMTGRAADVARAALSSVASQGVSMALGQQEKFSWAAVAGAAVAAGVMPGDTAAQGKAAPQARQFDWGNVGTEFVNSLGRGVISRAVEIVVNRGGKFEIASIAADSFGNALGNGIVGQMKFNTLPGDIREKSPEQIAKFERARLAAQGAHPGASSEELDDYARDMTGLSRGVRFQMSRPGGGSFLSDIQGAAASQLGGSPSDYQFGDGLGSAGNLDDYKSMQVFNLSPKDEVHETISIGGASRAFGNEINSILGLLSSPFASEFGGGALPPGIGQDNLLDLVVPGATDALIAGTLYNDQPEGLGGFLWYGLKDIGVDKWLGVDSSLTVKSHFGEYQIWHSMSPDPSLTNLEVRNLVVDQVVNWYSEALSQGLTEDGFWSMGRVSHTLADSFSGGHTLRDEKSRIVSFYSYTGEGQSDFHGAYDGRDDLPNINRATDVVAAALTMFKNQVPVSDFRDYLLKNVYAIAPGQANALTNRELVPFVPPPEVRI